MRTLVVVRTLKMGGMERVAISLAEAFAAEGHDSHLLYFKSRPNEIRPDDDRVTVHHIDISRKMRHGFKGLFTEAAARIANTLLTKSYSLVAGNLGGQCFAQELEGLEKTHGRFDRIVFRGVGTSELVWSFNDPRAVHVLENNLARPKKFDPLYRQRMKTLLQDKRIATVSTGVEKTTEQLARRCHLTYRHLKTITNPVPINAIQQRMTEPDSRIPETPYLLNVARLVPQKNHRRLLEAYALSGTDLPLYILGDGKLKAELQQLAERLGVASRVHFMGQVENPYPWMKNARLFILSSDVEGLGIVLVEALACATPVVTVDCPGGVRDVMGGKLEDYLSPMSSQGLAEKIRATLASDSYPLDDNLLAQFEPASVAKQFLEYDSQSGLEHVRAEH